MSSTQSSSTGLDAHLIVRRGTLTLDVQLTIEPGETVALLGPNGSGKTTTVDVLCGLLPLDDGFINLADRELDTPADGIFVAPPDRDIGVVFQDVLLFDHLSVLDNVAFGPSSRGEGRRAARAAATPWLEALGVGELASTSPRTLSGGQAQRVALARALATRPRLLLLDEPLAAVDIASRNELRRVIAKHLAGFAGPRLLITHDPADAFLLADRIVILEDGVISQVGPPEDIRRRPTTAYAAAVAGTNLLQGTNTNGLLRLDGRERTLQTSVTKPEGPVLVTIHPTAISLHRDEPHGSPRNTWFSVVDSVEPLGDTTRITLGDPLPLGVDITPAATAALGLEPGSPIWVSVKAAEIGVNPG